MDHEPRVTLETVARAAGVSVPTVSRVVSRRGPVAAGTRARVEQALEEYGYRPRPAKRRDGLIHVVFPGIACSWELEHLRGMESVAHDAGVGLVVSALRHRRELRRWAEAGKVGGAILAAAGGTASLSAMFGDLGVPAVALDPAVRGPAGLPRISAANRAGARDATRHLIELGHRRIAMIAGDRGLACSRDRLDGYRAALGEAGLAPDVEQGAFTHRAGLAAALRLFDRPARPTAVVASSDTMAYGVLEAARQRGIAVPDELSVTGFDDLPTSRWSAPPLTTVRQPMEAMGRAAAYTVLKLVRGEGVENAELGTRLVVRQSTSFPASA